MTATGAALALWVGFLPQQLKVSGEIVKRAGSGEVMRGSCAACGAPLTYEDGAIGTGEIYFTIAMFDEPETIRAEGHSYWGSRLPQVVIADDLPKYAGTARQRQGAERPVPI